MADMGQDDCTNALIARIDTAEQNLRARFDAVEARLDRVGLDIKQIKHALAVLLSKKSEQSEGFTREIVG